MSDTFYASRKNPKYTYVSKPIGKDGNVRYISRVFDIEEFKEFYYDQKEKKVYEVIQETQRQEVTAIYNKEVDGFSIRIQKFSKDTANPHSLSFSFHSGALDNFLNFLESIKVLDLSNSSRYRVDGAYIDNLLLKKRKEKITIPESVDKSKIIGLFNILSNQDRNLIVQKFLENIDLYEYENLDAAIKQREYKKALYLFQELIDLNESDCFINTVNTDEKYTEYRALQPEKIYQNWVEKNLWIFGVEYYKKYNFNKISEDNSKADIVIETMDGFLDLIEMKRPIRKDKMFRYDASHRCFFPARAFSEAIGQCLIYLQRLQDFKKNIELNYDVNILKPRIKLIIGRSNDYSPEEKEALHFINSSLHGVDVITFDQLILNGRKIISYYDQGE